MIFSTSLSWSTTLPDAHDLLKNWKDAMYTSKEISTMRMTISSPGRDPVVRSADVYFKSDNSKDAKILMKFSSPAMIKGTAFLSIKKEGLKNSDQWIYFPAYNKARRLSSRKKDDSFLDSDFSNGDISFEYHEGFKFNVLKETKINDQIFYILEGNSTPENESIYSRQVLYINKETKLNSKTEFYDRKGQFFKELVVNKWKKYGERWAIDEVIMSNLLTKSETKIEFTKRDIKSDPQDKLFTLVYLERGQ